MKQRSKRYKNLISKKEKNKKLNLKEIIKIIKESPQAKFDESVDAVSSRGSEIEVTE